MKTLLLGFSLLLTSFGNLAAEPAPVIKDYGYFYNVPSHVSDLSQAQFKIAFDVGDGAEKARRIIISTRSPVLLICMLPMV